MNWIAGGMSCVVVDAACEHLGPQPAVDEPLLEPYGFESRSGDRAKHRCHIRSAERAETHLGTRLIVWVVLIQRRAQARQDQESVKVSLKQHVYVHPLAQVSAIANKSRGGIEFVGRPNGAVLKVEPIAVIGNVIVTRDRRSDSSIQMLGP